MKKLIFIIYSFIILQSYGQVTISGQLFDLKSKEKIEMKKSNEMPRIWLNGNSKIKGFFVDAEGRFNIPMTELANLGDTLTFSISSFNKEILDNDYADLEIRNIPRSKLYEILSEIFVSKAYWIPSCGSDCFTINTKRTFRKKVVKIQTQYFTYYMRRNPVKMRKLELSAKYLTDLNLDLIK